MTGQTPQGDGTTILVVEDDPIIRATVCWALEEDGHKVASVANGRDALTTVAGWRPSLILLDMGLPIVDGDGVAAGVHATYGDTVPIVVVTADGHAVEKARRVGARAFLHKPFEMDDLLATVQRVLRSG